MAKIFNEALSEDEIIMAEDMGLSDFIDYESEETAE